MDNTIEDVLNECPLDDDINPYYSKEMTVWCMKKWASLQTPQIEYLLKDQKVKFERIAELEKEVERLKGLAVSQFSSTWEGEDNFDELFASFKTENNL